MLQCSDIERMARTGASPTSQEERPYLAHLASCPACRRLVEASGFGISTLGEDSLDAATAFPREGPPTMVGLPGESIERTQVDSPSLASLASPPRPPAGVNGFGLDRTQADTDSPARDCGQDTYSTAVPTEDDAYQTRFEDDSTGFLGKARPRRIAGWLSDSDSTIEQADPSWPLVPGYELLAKLGEGGMGVVYKARQRRLNRLVALKMIRGDGRAGEVQLNRFRIEAEAVARLHHPNIVQIYEIGDVAGLPYFSLELLEGGGLDSKLAGTPRPGREAAELVAPLCSAIEAAHEAQIIHRDLKPANVVLAADGTPKITDFGLAKRLEEEDSQTRTGDVMGSPSYMSPEQAKGQIHLVGPASDVYSLGAILYEMLTGRPPFRGTSAWDTVRQVAEEEPVPPSRLQPRVPRDLETIALKCLGKDPSRRYATARALGDDLRRYLAGEPILARPIPFWERGLKWARRRPAVAATSAFATLVLVGIVGASIWYAQYLEKERRIEADQLYELVFDGKETLAEGRQKFDKKELEAAKVLFDGLERSLAEKSSAIRSDPRVVDISRQLALELRRVGEAQDARVREQEFLAKLARFRGLRDEALFLDTSFDGLQQAGLDRDPEASGRKASDALDVFTKLGDDGSRTLDTPPAAATAIEWSEVATGCYEMLLILAETEFHRHSVTDAKARAERALQVLQSASGLGLPDTKAYHFRRKGYLEALGDKAGAAREETVSNRLEPLNAFDHYLYGLELYRTGQIAEAISRFREAREQDLKLFWPRALLAIAYVRSRRAAEGRLILTECLKDRPDFAWLYLLRGYASGQIGLSETRRDATSGRIGAFDAFDEGPGRNDGLRGNPPAASADFDSAEADFEKCRAKLRPGDADLRYTLLLDRGFVKLWGSKYVAAAADFEEAIELDPRRFNAYVNLAGVRFHQEDFDAAIDRLTEALKLAPEGSSKTGVLRFRAFVRERKSDLFGTRANREAAFTRALRTIDPRPDGFRLASSWWLAACRAIEARERQSALEDYKTILREPFGRPKERASDLVGQARLLLKEGGRAADALKAADEAIKADPDSTQAHRVRIDVLLAVAGLAEGGVPVPDSYRVRTDALLTTGLYDQAIESCDACIKNGDPSPELYAIRGRARAKNNDLAGAISDLTNSLELNPNQAQVLMDRGWTYLFFGYPHGSPRPALDDFEKAVGIVEKALGIDPTSAAEAYCGRGNARATLEMYKSALLDADTALRLDPRSPLNQVRCARIYAMAADAAFTRPRFDKVPPAYRENTSRALDWLRSAIQAQPPARRLTFYREVIKPDNAFQSIRRDPRLGPVVFEDLAQPAVPPASEARR